MTWSPVTTEIYGKVIREVVFLIFGEFLALLNSSQKTGFVGEQTVTYNTGLALIKAAFQPVTHNRTFKMLKALDTTRMQSDLCNVLQTLMRGRSRWADVLRVPVRGLRCVMSASFPFLPQFVYLPFGTAVYTRKEALSSQVMANTSELMSIRKSQSRISLQIFFNSSSGVTIAKPVNKMHIGVFFVGKRRVDCYFSLNTYHSAN
jgi:hypothetical protein